MYEKRELHRAIGELAYVIAKAQQGVKIEEKKAFIDIIKKELDYEAWAAESRFELLDEVVHPTIDQAYNEAIHEFKKYKDFLDDDLKAKAIRVLKQVADAFHGTSETQQLIMDRFRNDLDNL